MAFMIRITIEQGDADLSESAGADWETQDIYDVGMFDNSHDCMQVWHHITHEAELAWKDVEDKQFKK